MPNWGPYESHRESLGVTRPVAPSQLSSQRARVCAGFIGEVTSRTESHRVTPESYPRSHTAPPLKGAVLLGASEKKSGNQPPGALHVDGCSNDGLWLAGDAG